MMKKYDVIVIGAGGGSKIASPAYKLGLKVAIIEKSKLGGTCLNRGCIPSKMLIYPATLSQHIKGMKKFSVKASFDSVNFGSLVGRISRSVDKDSAGIETLYKKRKNFDYYHGVGRFVSDKVVEVNGKKITADKIFIATGARPFTAPIPGLKDVPFMTSTEALRRKKLPKKMIVIGGGYIGCELGAAYSALGCDVVFISRRGLLEREDVDVKKEFSEKFTKLHKVYCNVDTKKVSYKNKEFSVVIAGKDGKKKTLRGDALLVATGVSPNSDNLGLENTSIKTNGRGFIKVNQYMETAVKGVYAMGDVVGNYMFRHSVNFEGEFLFDTLFVEKKRKRIVYPPIPHAVFTYPEIAGVGKTEQDLKKGTYVKAVHKYVNSAQGMARLPDHGFVKLLFEKKSQKLIGAHIIGDEAATMIHHLIQAMTLGAKVDDLLKMVYIHPALPEIIRNAARKARDKFRK